MYVSKSKAIGRLELLAWINEILEADYPKVENLCDGIGYSQILDALNPSAINIFKVNLSAKSEADYIRNLRLVEDCLHKLKFYHKMDPTKLAKGKF
jgi:RP/EB family microtubule-associated protein